MESFYCHLDNCSFAQGNVIHGSCRRLIDSASWHAWKRQRHKANSKMSIQLDIKYDDVITTYKCQNITCACIPDRMLCGQDGGVSMCVSLHSAMETSSKQSSDSPSLTSFFLLLLSSNEQILMTFWRTRSKALLILCALKTTNAHSRVKGPKLRQQERT